MSKLILAFDTETTGLPDWKSPSGDECQPHMVQLAAALFDQDTREVAQSMNVIIKPDGWDIPQETIDIHGVTLERAMDIGVSEEMALDMFISIWGGCTRIAHNTTFDNRIIRIATKRYSDEQIIDLWKDGSQGNEWVCTMLAARKIMGGKQPTLQEAYRYFMGADFENAHSAWADTMACADVYWAIKDTIKDI